MSRAGNPFSAMASPSLSFASCARVTGAELAKMIFAFFLETEFEGGRHQRRVDMIMRLEAGETVE